MWFNSLLLDIAVGTSFEEDIHFRRILYTHCTHFHARSDGTFHLEISQFLYLEYLLGPCPILWRKNTFFGVYCTHIYVMVEDVHLVYAICPPGLYCAHFRCFYLVRQLEI